MSQQLSGDEIERQRLAAVSLMMRLCGCREVQQHRRRANRPKVQPCKDETITDVIQENPVSPDDSGVPDSFPLECEKRQCIICIGDEALIYELRAFFFSTRSKMMNRVKSHLRSMPIAHDIVYSHLKYRVQGTIWNGVLHFKNHMHVVHSVGLRS